MKYLVVIAVLLVVYLLWRSNRHSDSLPRDDSARAGAAPPALPQDMVRCEVCSLHLPRSEALPGASGNLYCSQEHRLTEKT